MRRFKGLLYHEYLLVKPFLLTALAADCILLAVPPVTALILKNAGTEYHEAMTLIIVPFIFVTMFNTLLALIPGIRFENSIPKRNCFVFSLPVTRLDAVLSRLFIPLAVNAVSLVLIPPSAIAFKNILGFEELSEAVSISMIFMLAFSFLIYIAMAAMFATAKEVLVSMLSFVLFSLILPRTGGLWRRVFKNVDFDADLVVSPEHYWIFYAIVICGFILTLGIAYLLAGRRNKLCEG